MNKRKSYFIAFCLGLLLLAGCNSYLDVQPEASYTEDQVFSSEAAIQQAVNGLYIDLSDNLLYGAFLSNTMVEILAQRYLIPTNGLIVNNFPSYQLYQYQQSGVQTEMDNMWKKAYTTILEANLFITKIDGAIQRHIVSEAHGQGLKGEALAMRAMLHFDLLRLFGPGFSAQATQPAIPYYVSADGQSQPILNNQQVIEHVLADLNQASQLLASDPVITGGILVKSDFYAGYRNQRLNYYAVKGLMARVYLCEGRNAEAHAAAKEVLDEGEKWFPWLPYNAIVSNPNPDRIFSTEVLFGVYNPDMYTNYTANFSPDLLANYLLRAEPNRLKSIFENNENDYRYLSTWFSTTQSFPTFFKFADLDDKTKPWRFVQPLLRKSELYYILAETEPDAGNALNYLNQVRYNRGLTDLTSGTDLSSELTKEYQKEFWGEGQLFFYYKRKNMTSIPSGQNSYATVSPVYIVPLPLSETTPR